MMLILILVLVFGSAAGADDFEKKEKAALNSLTAVPANRQNLETFYDLHVEGDLGSEQPSSILYYPKGSKDFETTLAITDSSLCTRPEQKKTCDAFLQMISGPSPGMGKDVTDSRIGGSDYTTAYLASVNSVRIDAVDRFVAFLGADSQDPPQSNVVLYIFAAKGTNLIQISAKVDECKQEKSADLTELAYYEKYCGTPEFRDKAMAVAEKTIQLFRLK